MYFLHLFDFISVSLMSGNGGDAAALGMLRKPCASEEGHAAASHIQLSGLQGQQTARLCEGPFICLSQSQRSLIYAKGISCVSYE